MINFFLTLAILIWPIGQLLQISPSGQVIRLQLLDVVAGFLFISLLFRRKKIISDPLFKPLAIFIIVATVSLVSAFFRNTTETASLLYLLRFVSYTSFYFALRVEGIKKYRKLFIMSAGVFLCIGFLQYIFIPDVRLLKYLGFDDHYYRLIGSFFDPNFTGLVLAIFTILFLNFSRYRFLFLIPLTALVLTFSRASYLSLAAGLIYLGTVKKQFKLLASLFLLGLILFLVPKPFGEGVNLFRTFSIVSRYANQAEAVKLFISNPLLGVGFNTLKAINQSSIPNLTSGVDNSFLFVLATTGIIGLATFLNFLKVSWKITKNSAVRAGLVATFTHSLFNNSFFYSWILALFFLLLNLKPRKTS